MQVFRVILLLEHLKFFNHASIVLVFQSEVYYKVNRLLTGLPAQQIGTTSQMYSNKTPLLVSTKDNKNKICKHAEIDRHFKFVTADF